MNEDCKERLRTCFRAVFPDANDDDIERADTANTETWDSVAQVTLVSVVEEEFGVTVPVDKLGEATSFKAFARIVGC